MLRTCFVPLGQNDRYDQVLIYKKYSHNNVDEHVGKLLTSVIMGHFHWNLLLQYRLYLSWSVNLKNSVDIFFDAVEVK